METEDYAIVRKDRVALLVKRTALVIEKLSNQTLAPYELSHTQYKVMVMLYRNPGGPVRQADIERRFSLTNPTVTGIVQNLEKKGLVERVRNPQDRRSKLVCLTARALSVREELSQLGESLERLVTQGLSEDECAQLCALLAKMLESH